MTIDLSKTPVTVKCTAPGATFDFRSMSGHEELGRLFEYEVDLSSTVPSIAAKDILGQSLTVCVPLDLMLFRYFNGIIVRFSRVGRDGRFFRYRATICPQLWLLSRNSDCRVFQGATVPEVAQWILKNGNVPIADKPALGPHRKWEYLTQYRESDFDFVSRILEQEGIYYYFKHEDGLHTMVLADSTSAHDVRPGYESVPLESADWSLDLGKSDHLAEWEAVHQIQTSTVLLDDYDFRLHKGANITAKATEDPGCASGPLVRFDYPGEYLLAEDQRDADLKKTQDAGAEYAKVQLEEHRAEFEQFHGHGNLRGLETGALFAISSIPEFEASQFLITAAHLELHNPTFASGTETGDEPCHVSLTAIRKERAFRPARLTRKPIVQGPQTARVVGDPGIGADEQIWTDEYGRIKVHFFWDRHGPSTPQTPGQGGLPGFLDHGNSCWVRVATSWAGSNWGSIHIPRIGQEVVVQFLEGDPDRPLVTGSVYNADNMPPYKLPDNRTQSGIKSRSTPKGTASNFNEMRFEDKKGAEEIYVHAEKNQTIQVKANRSVSVGGSESITVSGTRTTTIVKKDTVTIKDEHNMTVTQMASQYFKNGHIQNVYGADQEMFVEKGKTEYVTKAFSMESAEEITLTVGGSKITIAPDHIEISSPQISIKGTAMVDVVGGLIKLNS